MLCMLLCSCAICSCAICSCAMCSCAMWCACKCQPPHGLSTDQVADKLIGRPECQMRDSFKIGCFWYSIANTRFRSANQPLVANRQTRKPISQSECRSANQNADQQTRVQIRMPISSQSECETANQNANQQIKHATTRPSSQPSNRVPAAESRKSCGRHFYRSVRSVFCRFVLYLPRAHIPNKLTNLFYISVYFMCLSPRQCP